MEIYGIIPARGGSKGIPHKNIAVCCGRPLIAWTCEAASRSRRLRKTIVSTDDVEIADVARECGVDVPFMRPPQLALDSTPSVDVLRHALEWLESTGHTVEALALLQPTSPLRTERHIDAAVELFETSAARSLVSVVEVPHRFHPRQLLRREGDYVWPLHAGPHVPVRRQEVERLYARNGPAVLIAAADLLRSGRLYDERTVAFPMKAEESIDIDLPEDLRLAELLLSRGTP